jgi:hypothetical protein
MNDAIAFVTAAAHIGAGGRREPLPVLDSPEHWPAVVDLAIAHGVAPLLWEALSQAPETAAPAKVRDALHAQLLRSSATRLLCENTLADVVRILRGRGVEVIVLKGPTVAHSVYPRPELRIYHDLDLLSRIADYPVLLQALVENGYTTGETQEHPERGTREQIVAKPSPSESQQVRAFHDPSGDVKIEVHFDALQLGLRDRNEEQFWRESRTQQVGGIDIRVLAPEHQFLHLAVHAHRHAYSRLRWLIELDLLVRRGNDSMDWGLLTQVARTEGVGTALRHALATAHEVLGTPLPVLPEPTLEERCLGLCYRALWPFAKTRSLSQREHKRLLQFLPDDADLRNLLPGLVLVGRRREKLQALLRRRGPTVQRQAAR